MSVLLDYIHSTYFAVWFEATLLNVQLLFFCFFFKSRDETRAGENPYKFFSTPPLSLLIIPLEFLFRTSAELQSVREPYSSRASHPSSFIFVHLCFDFSDRQRPRLMFEAEPGWASGIHGHHGDPFPRCRSSRAPRQ